MVKVKIPCILFVQTNVMSTFRQSGCRVSSVAPVLVVARIISYWNIFSFNTQT